MAMALSSLQLDAFQAVAQTMNFTKAANLLHITQSALSQRILNLEQELETSLFIRDRAGLRLTETGTELVRYCRCKSSLEDEFLAGLKGAGLSGTVRIGGFSSVMQSVILPSLAGLFEKNPGLKLQMIVDEIGNLPARLHRGEIDLMVLDRREAREDLERIPLGKERNVLVQKRKYRGPDVFLDHDEADSTTLDYLRLTGRRPKKIERRYLDNVHAIIEGVRYGLGRAVLPEHLIAADKDFEILQPSAVLEIPVYLYFYVQPYYSRLHTEAVNAIAAAAPQWLEG
jgi:DNA-binding transcriptional LysR family regulator